MDKKVSIIMGIYNCEQTLADSLDSILKQSYQNWELVMCDDGSSDDTYTIAGEYAKKDSRIRLIRNPDNVGLAKTLNYCLRHCSGEFIMRHDGDDIMTNDRIEKQVKYMRENDCDACGSSAYLFDHDGVWGVRQVLTKPNKSIMITDSPFIHPTVIMKAESLLAVGGYSDNNMTRKRLEDYDLWLKFYEKGFILHNIQEPLLYFREDQDSYKRKSRSFRLTETKARLDACKVLNIPYVKRLLAFKPLIVLLIPKKSLRKYHIWQAKRRSIGANKSPAYKEETFLNEGE
ncbi:glycosyltransferase family 2 protein [Bacillus rubiinfantis]|uniref:glycosyltransferase family 2 protein n=1 Tax=Bacillus rubiinfantis TaxID=1499680 RepID=UPI0009E55A8D|nr:glycosyltransferase [Bacillus rubiinfantis]